MNYLKTTKINIILFYLAVLQPCVYFKAYFYVKHFKHYLFSGHRVHWQQPGIKMI